jgi:hypothetical protein
LLFVALVYPVLIMAQAGWLDVPYVRQTAEDCGLDVFVFRGTLEDLTHHTAKGRPVIVWLAPSRGSMHHAVVAAVEELALFVPQRHHRVHPSGP